MPLPIFINFKFYQTIVKNNLKGFKDFTTFSQALQKLDMLQRNKKTYLRKSVPEINGPAPPTSSKRTCRKSGPQRIAENQRPPGRGDPFSGPQLVSQPSQMYKPSVL